MNEEKNGREGREGNGPVQPAEATTATMVEDEPTPEQPGRSRVFTLAQMLVDAGILPADEVSRAQELAATERLPLGRILVRDGLVLSRDLATLTALHLGLPMVDLRSQTIEPEAVSLIPEDAARKNLVLGISREGSHLKVAMTDPTDLQLLQDLSARTNCTIEPVIATQEDIQEHIDRSYRLTQPLVTAPTSDPSLPAERVTARLLRDALPAQVIDLLLRQALQDRASDIHIEPSENRLRIRFRIDGILHEVMNLPPEMHPAILSRLKIMSGMNIAERRRPQDGQLNFQAADRSVDVRVAVANTVDGEMAVLRLLDNQQFTLISLGQLGMTAKIQEEMRRLLRLPYGMLIVCGPTGSGKSTTLYASILTKDRVQEKVITVENPVEYHIPDTNQMQVHADVGVTFATQLRSILRMDPDVIMVGEIRDQETAQIATEASLTGHIVLTTLHANDSVSALMRMQDLGVAPYLLASSVAGILAQRMVRMVCRECKSFVVRPIAEQQAFASEMGETRQRFAQGSGCTVCAQTGYQGRTGVYELLTISDEIKQLFLEGAPRDRLWAQAIEDGLVPLRHAGMEKVKEDVTTPFEVMRVLFTL
ncbi:MAG: type II/IV secretion system protein [Chloroflexi bacterium]|nr:type II/IV secretion system protein [Chloroflexota bacterium]